MSNYLEYAMIPNLRDARDRTPLEPDQIIELERCQKDCKYFMEKYYFPKIPVFETPWVEIRPHQHKYIDALLRDDYKMLVYRAPRQSGKTRIAVGAMLHRMIFKPYQCCGIITLRHHYAIEILRFLKEAYVSLPCWMQPGVTCWSKDNIVLGNGSRVLAYGLSQYDRIKGMSASLILVDDIEHAPESIYKEWIDFYIPTMFSGRTQTPIWYIGTPNRTYTSDWAGRLHYTERTPFGLHLEKPGQEFLYVETLGRELLSKEEIQEKIKRFGLNKAMSEFMLDESDIAGLVNY